jgi:hypothetical protein
MTGTLEAYIAYARAAMRTDVGGHPAFVCLFIAYIYFINMTLLNLITGVIVETVLQLARKDEIVEVNRQREEMDKNRRAMKSIFGLADRDSDAEVSFEEFHTALQSDKVVEHLHVLEITATDAAELFEIVDVDRSNTISMEEFMDGFGRLKGTAQAKHLLKLQCDGQRANTQLTTCLQAVERDMDERYEGLTLLVEESCSAWERRMLAHLGPGYAPWIAEMDFQECSRTVMQLQREVAELAASSPQLQQALRAKGVPLGTLTPAPESSDEVVVHARALGANLAALQLTCG